jgi:hypothetical protein
MILTDLTDTEYGDRRRISMRLHWEDQRKPSQILYFEARNETAALLRPTADGFALACLPLAMGAGERRLRVEGVLCTRLRAGLRIINEVLHGWFPQYPLIEVEASDGFRPTTPPPHRRVATQLSGGVDGLTTLRRNRLDYPLDHPESIRGCITLFGINTFDVDVNGPVRLRLDAFDALLQRLQGLAEAEQFALHPVWTNVRSLAPNYRYWTRLGFGAGHFAVAQLFRGTYDKVLAASDGEGASPAPGALHPLFESHLSTDAVRIQGAENEMTRVDKLALLADWDAGRRLMQPCHYVKIPPDGQINCGRCEKCLRTMLILIGLGKLDQVSAFSENDVPVDRIFRIPVNNWRKARLLAQAIPSLQGVERRDLVWAIRARLALFYLLRR